MLNRKAILRLIASKGIIVGSIAFGLSAFPQVFSQDGPEPTPPGKHMVIGQVGQSFEGPDAECPIFVGREWYRSILLFKDRSPRGKEAGWVIYYYPPTCALYNRPASDSLRGIPAFVHKIERVGTTTYLTFVFQLSAPKLDDVCKAILLRKESEPLAEERRISGDKPVRIKVGPAKVLDLMIAVKDGLTDATLAYKQEVVASAGSKIAITFPFAQDALAVFYERAAQGRVRFQPIYLPKGQHFERGVQRTVIDYAQILSAVSRLDTKEKPIFKGHIDQIAKDLDVKIWHDIAASGPNVLNMFGSFANSLIASLFHPDRDVSIDKLREEWRGFDAAEVAKYLAAIEHSVSKSLATSESKGERIEKGGTTTIEFGGGVSIPFSGATIGAGSSFENRRHAFEELTKASGIQFEQTDKESVWKARSVTVYKAAAGRDKQGLHEVSSVYLGNGALTEYILDSPFDQFFTTSVVDASLDRTLHEEIGAVELFTRKQQPENTIRSGLAENGSLQAKVLEAAKGLDQAVARLAAALGDREYEHAVWHAAYSAGILAELDHFQKLWGLVPCDPGERPGRLKDMEKSADEFKAIKAQRAATIKNEKSACQAGIDIITANLGKIREIRKAIAVKRAEVESIDAKLGGAAYKADLVARKAQLLGDLKAKESETTAAEDSQFEVAERVRAAFARLVAAHDDQDTFDDAVSQVGYRMGIIAMIDHFQKIWNIKPKDPQERVLRSADLQEYNNILETARAHRDALVTPEKAAVRSGIDAILSRAVQIEAAHKQVGATIKEIEGIDAALISRFAAGASQ